MREITELTDDLLPTPFRLSDKELEGVDRESEFLRFSFELAKEITHWLLIFAGLATKPLGLNEAILSLASWKGPGFRQWDGTGVPGCGGGGVMFASAVAGVKDVGVVAGFGRCRLR